ncbi:unnamed protein product [Rangifer tarandus platyrhynchus]|uniref:Uncharacterized protein n=2 Tax=Rangifer tarandus platyrhynchus TaxID=3082113 RepID=A0ABN8XT20_RANTA|nr:unnamed protein product [Rangifer tarandus platyrhynchus]CAI9690337.1 unnamed protein product [Rangifer tarandus platyrhynchus]
MSWGVGGHRIFSHCQHFKGEDSGYASRGRCASASRGGDAAAELSTADLSATYQKTPGGRGALVNEDPRREGRGNRPPGRVHGQVQVKGCLPPTNRRRVPGQVTWTSPVHDRGNLIRLALLMNRHRASSSNTAP